MAKATIDTISVHKTRAKTKTEMFNYNVALKYRFAVDGREYEGSRFYSDGNLLLDQTDADRVTNSYKNGNEIEVHYNLKKHLGFDDSFIEPSRANRERFNWFLATGIGGPICICIAIAGWKHRLGKLPERMAEGS